MEATWSNPGAGEQHWFLGTLTMIRAPAKRLTGAVSWDLPA